MGKFSFNRILRERENVVGCFLQYKAPFVVELLGYLGMDYIIFDLEHAELSLGDIPELTRTAEAADIVPLVRLPYVDENYIKKVLDMGICGIMAPRVESREEAEELVRLARFQPDGERGNCPYVRANKYGIDDHEEFYRRSNEDIMIYVALESKKAVDAAEEIISVPGIDAVGVGNVDLARDMGFGRDSTHPEVLECVRKVAAAAKKHGVHSDGFVIREEDMETLRSYEGIDYFCLLGPAEILTEAYGKQIRMVKNHR